MIFFRFLWKYWFKNIKMITFVSKSRGSCNIVWLNPSISCPNIDKPKEAQNKPQVFQNNNENFVVNTFFMKLEQVEKQKRNHYKEIEAKVKGISCTRNDIKREYNKYWHVRCIEFRKFLYELYTPSIVFLNYLWADDCPIKSLFTLRSFLLFIFLILFSTCFLINRIKFVRHDSNHRSNKNYQNSDP